MKLSFKKSLKKKFSVYNDLALGGNTNVSKSSKFLEVYKRKHYLDI